MHAEVPGALGQAAAHFMDKVVSFTGDRLSGPSADSRAGGRRRGMPTSRSLPGWWSDCSASGALYIILRLGMPFCGIAQISGEAARTA